MPTKYSWRKWWIGFGMAVGAAALSAGAAAVSTDAFSWKPVIAVFCTSVYAHVSTFLKNHPVEDNDDDTHKAV
jgi:hypothetical protein